MTWIFWFYLLPVLFLWWCLVRYTKREMAKEHKNRNRDMTKVALKEILYEANVAFMIPLIPLLNIVLVCLTVVVAVCMWVNKKTGVWNKLMNVKL